MSGHRDVVRMIVLEGDDRLRGLLARLFTESGYDVADTGSVDVATAQAGEVDVVLADWDLAGADGVARLAGRAPTVVLAADGDDEDAAVRAGAVGFALKGDDLSLLTDQLTALVPPPGG